MFLNRIKAALLAGAIVAAAVVPSFALFTDPEVISGQKIIPTRSCGSTQNTCYVRATINFNDPSIGNGVWAFTLPPNAYVTQVVGQVTTAFNATTTNAITIGATATGTDFLASTSVTSAGVLNLSTAAGLGVQATGQTALQTKINGGVPVFFRYTQTGTAATAGSVTIVIIYAKNDDK
jgi:hypothetical protein